MMFECLFFSLTLQGQRAVRSTATYFEQVLCRSLWINLILVFIVFLRRDGPFRQTREFAFPLAGAATIYAKLQSKIAKIVKKYL